MERWTGVMPEMSREARHATLNCKPQRGVIEETVRRYQNFRGVGNYPNTGYQAFFREDDIHSIWGILCLHHLGYATLDSVDVVVNRGFDVAVEYFCDDSWRTDPASKSELDKTGQDGQLTWAASFAEGLLFGLMSERSDDLIKVCDWVEANLRHEFPEDYEDELVSVYKSLAAGLRTRPMAGLDEIEQKVVKCRTLRPRVLFQAWDAARSGDQNGFEKHLAKMLKHSLSNMDQRASPRDWVALHASNVCAAGRSLGMKMPELPPELAAMLMTRESLGLSSSTN